MSYDIQLLDPDTGKVIALDPPHQMKGGTYQVGGETTASLNITYNYAKHFYKHIDTEEGIRSLYGLTGAVALSILTKVIDKLQDDDSDDYWAPTEGNAKKALCNLKALCQMHPEGILQGD